VRHVAALANFLVDRRAGVAFVESEMLRSLGSLPEGEEFNITNKSSRPGDRGRLLFLETVVV